MQVTVTHRIAPDAGCHAGWEGSWVRDLHAGGTSQPVSARICLIPAAAGAGGWTTGDPMRRRFIRSASHVFSSGEEIP